MALGDDLRTLREEKGYTRKVLAEKIGVSEGSIANWETGASHPLGDNRERVMKFMTSAAKVPLDLDLDTARVLWDYVNLCEAWISHMAHCDSIGGPCSKWVASPDGGNVCLCEKLNQLVDEFKAFRRQFAGTIHRYLS